MKKNISLFILITLTCLSSAQTIISRDPEIKKMVDEISGEKIEQYIRKMVSFHTRHNLSNQNDPKSGIGAAWNWIKAEMENNIPASNGRLDVKFEEYTVGGKDERIPHVTKLKNVVATLKGTDPEDDRIILISAHLDSRAALDNDSTGFAPGANDDGSGVAAILELIRIMSARKFSGTIVFMAVSGEEHGLYGAKFMAAKARQEKWNIIAMLNNDMIGNSGSSETFLNDNMRVRVFSEGVPAFETEQITALRKYTSGENDSKARQLARYIKETGERYVDQMDVTLVFRNDRFGRGGDHTPFCQQGFTAVRVCEYNENYDRTHKIPALVNGIQEGDLPEYVDYEYVRKNAGINLATIANLALAPYEPVNCGIVTGNEITLPYSKDNYFFGIQSVDAAGHESIAAFPGQTRKQSGTN